jgi:hypothetical protein
VWVTWSSMRSKRLGKPRSLSGTAVGTEWAIG